MDKLSKEEIEQYRALIGQLNWLATQTRPDIAFDVCELSAASNNATIEEILKANKTVRKVKRNRFSLKFCPLECPEQLSVECYSDASFGNLPGGGSQGD